MKILIYVNGDKDPKGEYFTKMRNACAKYGIDYDILKEDAPIGNDADYSALFVYGGDGTILRRTAFANRYGIPVCGINGGKLGFLTEFEASEIDDAFSLFKDGKLVKDERETLKILFGDNVYYALNDLNVARVYGDDMGKTVTVNVFVDGKPLRKVIGDGVIVSTPTGSTGYSFSAGGAVLRPEIPAFCITPVAPHSLNRQSFIVPSFSEIKLSVPENGSALLFADGKKCAELVGNGFVTVVKAERNTAFLRKPDYDFFERFNKKMTER